MIPLSDIASQNTQKNLELLKTYKGSRKALDPDAIHDLRVATRRLRAYLKTFKKLLPTKAEKVQTELKKLGSLLGKKRDLDLLDQFTHRYESPRGLKKEMGASQKEILNKLQSKRYERLIRFLERFLAVKAKKKSEKKIQRTLDHVQGIAIEAVSDDKTLHRLRIAVKKLRYTCELFKVLYDKRLEEFIEKCKKIQDILGEHQDAITGISLLERYPLPPKSFSLIKKKYELKKSQTRRQFFKVWKGYRVELQKAIFLKDDYED